MQYASFGLFILIVLLIIGILYSNKKTEENFYTLFQPLSDTDIQIEGSDMDENSYTIDYILDQM